MLNFVRKAFRGGLEAILWINLILWAVGGGIIANMTYSVGRYGSSGIHPVIGVLLGIIVGIIINIVGGGFIANFLNMADNIEKQTAILMHIYGKDLPKEVISKVVNKKETATVDKNDEPKLVTSSTPLANNQIKIIRLKGVVGSALLVDVNVDNQNFKLENGEEKIINLENGKHIISTLFNNDYEKFEFEIYNNSKTFNVFIKPPIKIQEV